MALARRRTRPRLRWLSKNTYGTADVLARFDAFTDQHDELDRDMQIARDEAVVELKGPSELRRLAEMLDYDDQCAGPDLSVLTVRVQPYLLERLHAMAWHQRLTVSELARSLLLDSVRRFTFEPVDPSGEEATDFEAEGE